MSELGPHVQDELLDLAYGELLPARQKAVERHLSACAECTKALEEIQGVRRVMQKLPAQPAPEAGLSSLLAYAEQAAKRAAEEQKPTVRFRRWVAPLTGVLALGVVAVVASRVADQVPIDALTKEAYRKQEAAAPSSPPLLQAVNAEAPKGPPPPPEAAPSAQAQGAVATAAPSPTSTPHKAKALETFGENVAQEPMAKAKEANAPGNVDKLADEKKAAPPGHAEAGAAPAAKQVDAPVAGFVASKKDVASPGPGSGTGRVGALGGGGGGLPSGGTRAAMGKGGTVSAQSAENFAAPKRGALGGEAQAGAIRGDELAREGGHAEKSEELSGSSVAQAPQERSREAKPAAQRSPAPAEAKADAPKDVAPAQTVVAEKAKAPPSPAPPTADRELAEPSQPAPPKRAQKPTTKAESPTRSEEKSRAPSMEFEDDALAAPAAQRTEVVEVTRGESAGEAQRRREAKAQAQAAAQALSDQAWAAYRQGDRALEARKLQEAISAGAEGGLLSGLLNRLCDAQLALGQKALAARSCRRVTSEFAGTSAARVAQKKLQQLDTATMEQTP